MNTRYRRKTKNRRRIFSIGIVLLLVAGAVLISDLISDSALDNPASDNVNRTESPDSDAESTDADDILKNTLKNTLANVLNDTFNNVLLVNADHAIPVDYKDVEVVDLVGKVPVRDDNVKVAAKIEKPLTELMTAAEDAGYSDIYVNSGYRTEAKQRQLYRTERDKSYVQKPGHSEHQTGLAVDLASTNSGGRLGDASDEGLYSWLSKNSWRYGFILRYPEDKTKITGISYEPWHFRYVGKPVAKICYEQKLCLEEYVEGINQ